MQSLKSKKNSVHFKQVEGIQQWKSDIPSFKMLTVGWKDTDTISHKKG